MSARLLGRVALVTGAARGIGRAVAERLAAEGADVAINDLRDGPEAEAAVAAVTAASGRRGRVMFVAADVADATEVGGMVDAVVARFGRLDILVNNAGIADPTPFGADFDPARYHRLMDINLTGAVLCAARAIAAFEAPRAADWPRPTIVNCSSAHEIIPKPGYLAYAISKGGMGALTRTLALEYAAKGIRVNAVGPGATLTDMNARWAGDPAQRTVVEGHIPLGRAAEAAEIAAAVAFLVSDDASYITGQTLYVCGGLTLYADFQHNWST